MFTTKDQFEAAIADVSFRDWNFRIGRDGRGSDGAIRFFLQVRATTPCSVTGKPYEWGGRKWFLSSYMTQSEVLQTALMAALTAVEHEAREDFKWQGKAIFGPHYDVDALHYLCKKGKAALDVRDR